uniref:Urotensin-related peptide 1 n=1 Tax=Pygocentrus nattereri TaxID=42514 RepID=A0A3B4E7R4_PYGNA
MLSVALLYILAVVFSATRALPLYPETVLTPQEDLLQKLVAEVEEGQSDDLSEQRGVKSVFPVLLQRERDRDSWPKGEKI